jgi:hypothetical protein
MECLTNPISQSTPEISPIWMFLTSVTNSHTSVPRDRTLHNYLQISFLSVRFLNAQMALVEGTLMVLLTLFIIVNWISWTWFVR